MNAELRLKMIMTLLEGVKDDDGETPPVETPPEKPVETPSEKPIEEKPAPPPPASVVGQPSPPPTASPGLTEEAIMAMTPAQIQENWDGIREYMAKNGF